MKTTRNKWWTMPLWAPEDGSGGAPVPEPAPAPAPEPTTAPASLIGADADGDDTIEGGEPKADTTPSPFEAIIEPEAFTAALGEDFEVTDPESFNKFVEAINSAGSREEIAKNLLGVYSETIEASAKASEEAFQATQTQWQEATKNDPTYGGEKLDQSLAVAKTVAKEYGGKDFLQLLNLTGAGNNLAMVAFLNKVAAALPKEGTPVAGTPTQSQRSLAERLFPQTEGS